MERGAIGELIPADGEDGRFRWVNLPNVGLTYLYDDDWFVAAFAGPLLIRLERVALFLTTEQS